MAICLPSPHLSLYQLSSSKLLFLKGLLWKRSVLILVECTSYQPSQLCMGQRQQTLVIPFHTLLIERLGFGIGAVQEGTGTSGGFDYPHEFPWEVSTPLEKDILRDAECRSNSYGVINFVISLTDSYVQV